MRKLLLGMAAITGTLVVVISCQREITGTGDENAIIVIADSTDYAFLHDELSRTFEREIPTPWPEKIFELKQVPVRQMKNYLHHPQLLLLGVLGSGGPASNKIREMLTPEVTERIKNGKNYVLKKDDPWGKAQRLLVLCSIHLDTLKQRIAANRDELFELCNQPLLERTKREMYGQFEQKKLAEAMLRKYGWSLRIQHDYHLYKEFPQENFVMLRRLAPERWLFVSWQPLNDPKLITRAAVVEWRNRLGNRFYENDRIVEDELTSRAVDFAGRRALELQGLWENKSKVAGGPFKAWAFYDENTRCAFLIDIAVFAPGKEKIKYLRQLEIMARTFHKKEDRLTDSEVN
jgi:hypothetical protein